MLVPTWAVGTKNGGMNCGVGREAAEENHSLAPDNGPTYWHPSRDYGMTHDTASETFSQLKSEFKRCGGLNENGPRTLICMLSPQLMNYLGN